jgi:hypothetical protein
MWKKGNTAGVTSWYEPATKFGSWRQKENGGQGIIAALFAVAK